MPPPLRLTLAFVVALLIAVHLLLNLGIEILLEQPLRVEKQQLASARQLIDKVQQTLSTDMAFGNRSNARQIISIQATDPSVDLLALIDQDGRVLYSTRYAQHSRAAHEVIPDFDRDRFTLTLRQQRLSIGQLASGDAITAYAPLPLSAGIDQTSPRRVGALFLRYDLARAKRTALRATLSPVNWPGWVLSLLVSTLAILFLLNRWISQPLRKLERIIGQVARGEPAEQSGFTGSGEIAQLGMGIDRMRRDIEATKEALQRANLDLELRVEERTRHLQREIALREQAEYLLSASERQLQIVLNSVTDGVALWDGQRRLQYANPAFRSLMGLRRQDETVRFDQETRLLGPDGDALPAEEFPITQTLRDGQPRTGVIVAVQRQDGGPLWLNVNVIPVNDGGAVELDGVVASVTDITELKSHETLLDRLANFDALTNLPNRRLLHDRMCQLVEHARRQDRILAVCYLDLDGFKEVNDRYGHKGGDRLLIEAAGRLGHCVRAGDTLARMGGDEFVFLLTDLEDESECESILQRILHALSNPYTINGERELGVTASIGITLFPSDDSDPDTLLRHADQAMYAAKRAGKNRYQWFDPGHENRILAQRDTLMEIEQALENGDLILYYQPKLDCRSLCLVGVEALLRWRHPILGILPPAHFLPLVEEEEIALRIGESVMQQALQQADSWRRSGHDLPVSINLSARQLQQQGFCDRLIAMQHKIGGGRRIPLEIEIVENAALEGVRDLPGLVSRCTEAGISFSLDDYGTGYTTLEHLRRIPARALKIDRSFIGKLMSSEADRTLVQAIIGLGHAFGRRIIAEGVERAEQLRWLREAGCDEMQGFLIAEPMAPDSLLRWIADYRPDPSLNPHLETNRSHAS